MQIFFSKYSAEKKIRTAASLFLSLILAKAPGHEIKKLSPETGLEKTKHPFFIQTDFFYSQKGPAWHLFQRSFKNFFNQS